MSVNFKEYGWAGAIHGLSASLMEGLTGGLTKGATQYGENFIKSKIFGIGTNDNHLFESAKTYAVLDLGVSVSEMERINKLINSLKPSQRNRLIDIVGKNEESTKTSSGKVMNTNVEGGRMFAVWAKMTDKQIMEDWQSMGVMNTIASKVGDFSKKVVEAAENSGISDDLNDFFSKKSWLEKLADGAI